MNYSEKEELGINTRSANKGNQSIHRCFDILESLMKSTKPKMITQMADDLGMSPSALHPLLKTMIERGYVIHLGAKQGYVLGPSLSHLCLGLAKEQQLLSISKSIVEEMWEHSDNETVYFGFFRRFSVEHLFTKRSTRQLGLRETEITTDRLHASSMGKILLSYLPQKDWLAWKKRSSPLDRFTPFTITSYDFLEKELLSIRQNKYAVNDQESEEGVFTVAVPVFNYLGHAIASLAVGMPLARYNEHKRNDSIEQLKIHAAKISRQLGSHNAC